MIAKASQLKIERTTAPVDALILRNWYVPTDQTRLEIVVELFKRMACDADNTLVLLATKDGELMGVAVSFIERSGRLFFWQGRSRGLSMKEVDMVIEASYDWAREKGVTTAATVPNRSKKLWERRWGFQEVPGSSEMVKEI